MDNYKELEVVSGPDETPLRVHKALSHLGFFWGNLMYCVTCHIN